MSTVRSAAPRAAVTTRPAPGCGASKSTARWSSASGQARSDRQRHRARPQPELPVLHQRTLARDRPWPPRLGRRPLDVVRDRRRRVVGLRRQQLERHRRCHRTASAHPRQQDRLDRRRRHRIRAARRLVGEERVALCQLRHDALRRRARHRQRLHRRLHQRRRQDVRIHLARGHELSLRLGHVGARARPRSSPSTETRTEIRLSQPATQYAKSSGRKPGASFACKQRACSTRKT